MKFEELRIGQHFKFDNFDDYAYVKTTAIDLLATLLPGHMHHKVGYTNKLSTAISVHGIEPIGISLDHITRHFSNEV